MGKRKGKRKVKLTGEGAEEAERDAQRELLGRELRMAEANDRRQRIAWRRRMIALNLPIAREELEAAWRTFDRAVDDRDYSISVLLDELRLSKEQKRRADFSHAAEIDRLLELCKQHLDEREAHYENRIDQALNDVEDQALKMEQEEDEKDLLLRTLVFSTKLKHQEDMDNVNAKNFSKLDGMKEENDNVLRMAAVILKRRLRNHSEELAGVLRDHEESTSARRKDFEKLKEKDDNDQRAIALNALRIEKLYEVLHALKIKIAEFRQQADKEIGDCVFERDYFRAAKFTIQKRILSEQLFDRENLSCLITEYNKTEEYLKQCVAKLEQILSVNSLCDKYETYEDKLLLHPLSTAAEVICAHDLLTELEEDEIQQLFAGDYPLHKFSRVVSKVNADISHLKISIKNLINESRQLKCSLKSYMNQVTRPDSSGKKECPATFPMVIEIKDVLH